MTEQHDHENEHSSAQKADHQPQVKPELIKDLDVPTGDLEGVAGGNSTGRSHVQEA